ncbi:uncharacterized protein I303_100524 [Kwoniella dejecticola CBS 10117]|uniref:intramembrane prenyl-peptidase Rce1 n=1 Tax=Kwoniella dejecticola CBS 10117 TaxID=1296121 RepID=A0A1A6AFA4_9TREE|nr:uncharacterized protein I303_00525 [Kwoniella dejecticola CBS 10117]OBR88708.1 hypothetical protein I303_00525 [Kwoniella dejecticola CBS 10117]
MGPTIAPPSLVGIISPSTSHALSFLFTTSYVGSLYLSHKLFTSSPSSSPKASIGGTPKKASTPDGNGNSPAVPPISSTDEDDIDPNPYRAPGPKPGSRDHPDTIKKRMIAVTISTALSLSGVYLTINNASPSRSSIASISKSITLLGLRLPTLGPDIIGNVLPYALAPILMSGPLYATYLDGDLSILRNRYGEGLWAGFKRTWRSFGLIELRNYVVGPITEELVFRSTILSVSILGGLSFKSLVFATPLWFGIAHAHHALETYRKNGATRDAAIHAILGCLFQLSYTTLFGWFASYLYLKTGSVLPPLTSHIFCNVMGIYLPTSAAARHPRREILIWTSYLAGIAGFVWGLRRL